MGEGGADGELLAGAYEAPPDVAGVRPVGTQEQAFDPATRRALRVQTGGKHRGVVAKQRVAGAKKAGQIGKGVVRDGAGGAIDDQQARLVATRGGRLGDQARRKFVVEKVGGEWHACGRFGDQSVLHIRRTLFSKHDFSSQSARSSKEATESDAFLCDLDPGLVH